MRFNVLLLFTRVITNLIAIRLFPPGMKIRVSLRPYSDQIRHCGVVTRGLYGGIGMFAPCGDVNSCEAI